MEKTNKIPETHPLEPFLPHNARILMLGSFPPKKEKWSMDFFYPNMQNDMWRIFGIVFFNDKDYFLLQSRKKFDKDKIKTFLTRQGIALGDTAQTIIRHKDNASDKFLEVVEPTDLKQILSRLPECKAIITTGQKATDTLLSLIQAAEPKVGSFSAFNYDGRSMRLYRMPSSSRAYPKPLEEKAAVYKQMFLELNML